MLGGTAKAQVLFLALQSCGRHNMVAVFGERECQPILTSGSFMKPFNFLLHQHVGDILRREVLDCRVTALNERELDPVSDGTVLLPDESKSENHCCHVFELPPLLHGS